MVGTQLFLYVFKIYHPFENKIKLLRDTRWHEKETLDRLVLGMYTAHILNLKSDKIKERIKLNLRSSDCLIIQVD